MTCVYNKILMLQIVNHNGLIEEKNLNLIIINGHDALTIKMRDPSEYTFNYNENIDLGDYEIMRVKQNLDINFNEFKSNLLEMLVQLQSKEMFLRCEISDQLCTLVFFNKSKIKSIVYLTVELHAASQKEIINEMLNSLTYMKDSNEKLHLQVTCIRKTVTDKDKEIKQLIFLKNEMERQFYSVIKEVEDNVNMKTREVECFLLRKIKVVTQKILKVLDDVNNLQKATTSTSDSSTRLVKHIEELKLENSEQNTTVEQLRKENRILQMTHLHMEKNLTSLRHSLNEKDMANKELQHKNDELQIDMEKATMVIAQKKSAIDMLSKDLVQANQMLVNFNHHYDTKVKALDNLQCMLNNTNQIIEEEKAKNYELQREFDGYKTVFSENNLEKLKHDLIMAQNKIDELEQNVRKTNKINALLSEKVNKIMR